MRKCLKNFRRRLQFFWEMIKGIPLFHDLGKINPDFRKTCNAEFRNYRKQ